MARSNDENVMNTTVIMHNMIIDICKTALRKRDFIKQNFFRPAK